MTHSQRSWREPPTSKICRWRSTKVVIWTKAYWRPFHRICQELDNIMRIVSPISIRGKIFRFQAWSCTLLKSWAILLPSRPIIIETLPTTPSIPLVPLTRRSMESHRVPIKRPLIEQSWKSTIPETNPCTTQLNSKTISDWKTQRRKEPNKFIKLGKEKGWLIRPISRRLVWWGAPFSESI